MSFNDCGEMGSFLFSHYVCVLSATVWVHHVERERLIESDGSVRRHSGASFPSAGAAGEKGNAEWVWSDEEHRVHRGCYLSHSTTADVCPPTHPPARQTIDLCCVATKTFTKQT